MGDDDTLGIDDPVLQRPPRVTLIQVQARRAMAWELVDEFKVAFADAYATLAEYGWDMARARQRLRAGQHG